MSSIVALLTQDARERSALDPLFWRIAVDVRDRIERAVGAALNGTHAPARELWFVAEHAGTSPARLKEHFLPQDRRAGILRLLHLKGRGPGAARTRAVARSQALPIPPAGDCGTKRPHGG
jgi:hypothetical protein